MRRAFFAFTVAFTMFVAIGSAWQAANSGPYKVVKTAKDIEAEPSQGMLPPVGEISRFISAPTHPQETGEQREQGDRAPGERARI